MLFLIQIPGWLYYWLSLIVLGLFGSGGGIYACIMLNVPFMVVFTLWLIVEGVVMFWGPSLVDRFAEKWGCLGLRYAKYAKEDGGVNHAEKAAKYFLKSAVYGGVTSLINLGLCYAEGFGVKKDPEKAARCYKIAAKRYYRYAIGQLALGFCYAEGLGVEKDMVKAEDLLKIDLREGWGWGLLDDYWNLNEVIMWIRKAAEWGNFVAQWNLGLIYTEGRGVEKNEGEAARWFRKITQRDSQHDFIDPTTVKWAQLFLSAIEHGDDRSQYELGHDYYEYGGDRYRWDHNFEESEREAAKWYRKAAEQGNADAQYRLGFMYAHGKGVEKDEVEAARWYYKAAERGDSAAQYSLGLMYANGEGVEKDEAKAVQLFRKAAEQGHVAAQFNVGVSYHYGWGVAKDESEAMKWYRKAAVLEDSAAHFYLKAVEQGGPDVHNAQIETHGDEGSVGKYEAEAVRWYRKAAEQGDAKAQCQLGWCYEFGKYVIKDETEAMKWYRKAAGQGDQLATERIEALKLSERIKSHLRHK